MTKKFDNVTELSNPMEQFKAKAPEEQAKQLAKMIDGQEEKDAENYNAVIEVLENTAKKFQAFAGWYEVYTTGVSLGIDDKAHKWYAKLAMELSQVCSEMAGCWGEESLQDCAAEYEDWLDDWVSVTFCDDLIDGLDECDVDAFVLAEALIAQVCQKVWPVIAQFGTEHKAMTREIDKFMEVAAELPCETA